MSTILSSLCCCEPGGFVICPTDLEFKTCQETISPEVTVLTNTYVDGTLVTIVNWEWHYFIDWLKIASGTFWILPGFIVIHGVLHVYSDSGPGPPFDNTHTFGPNGSGADIGHGPHTLNCHAASNSWRISFQWITIGLNMVSQQPINGCPTSGFVPFSPGLCPPLPGFTGTCIDSVLITL